MAKIIVWQGTQVVREIQLVKSPFMIGRALESDLAVMDHLVSRKHARIERDDGSGNWRVFDLGSSNGIFVNDVRVYDRILGENDRLRVGSAVLEFHGDVIQTPSSVARVQRAGPKSGSLSVTLTGRVEDDPAMSVVKSISDLRPEYAGHTQGAEAQGMFSRYRERRRSGDAPQVAGSGGGSSRHTKDGKEGLHFLLLFKVAEAMNSAASLEDLFDRAVDMLCEALDASCGAILTLDKDTGQLVQRATRDRRRSTKPGSVAGVSPALGAELRISQTIVSKVIADKVAVLSRDALADENFKSGKSVAAMQIRSAICVPIWDQEVVEGIIYLDTSNAIGAFNEDDRDLVTAIGHQLAVAMKREEMTARLKAEAVVRSNLERYHSPDIVEMILRSKGEVGLEVKEADVTVLFADIEGFTKMSEQMAPADVAGVLNGYFEGATAAIFKYRGQVNKYIGDAIMAVFGAPIENPDHAADACRAALAMQVALDEYRRLLPPEAKFRMRIGINSGPVVAGNIGAARRMEYTVIGNTVNIASRLEHVAPPDGVAMGPEVERRVRGRFTTRALGPVRLKGLEKDIEVFCLEP